MTEVIEYKNSFYSPRVIGSYESFRYSNPVNYKGYLIFHYSKDVFHIVKDNICIGMMAGINGAKKRIDNNEFYNSKEIR